MEEMMKKEQTKSVPSSTSSEPVRISYGATPPISLPMAGITVKEAREKLQTALNIQQGALSFVKGEQVNDSHILQPGEELHFVKMAGTKGC